MTGFLGAGSKPQPISEREAARYFGGVAEAKAAPKHQVNIDYEIGDQVKVPDGPFASFNGVVEELDFEQVEQVKSAFWSLADWPLSILIPARAASRRYRRPGNSLIRPLARWHLP